MGAAMVVEAGIAVKALLQGATPERKQEIEDLWDRYAPKVCGVEDAPGVNISAGKGRIQFDHKTLEAIWLLGFNGWRSIDHRRAKLWSRHLAARCAAP